MPDISEYYSGGKSLKAEDIDDEMVVTVEGWRKQKFDDGGESYLLKLKGEEKEFRVNRTNAKRIAEMFGSDIDGWVGKELSLLPDVISSGQYAGTSTIIVRVRKTARNAPKAKPKYDDRNPPPREGTRGEMDDDIPFAPEWRG